MKRLLRLAGHVPAKKLVLPESRQSGFTFTELLVVVALGAVLVGTVLPALNTASDTTKAAVCLANMHEWGMAISMYCEDWKDYFPYEGSGGTPIDGGSSLNAWFNVVPPYLHQLRLVDLYLAGKPPTPLTKGIWSCPSATNITVSPTLSSPYFMYAFNGRMDPNGQAQFKRSQMVDPIRTIVFAEEAEDSFPNTTGKYCPARHFGGGNFVMGDAHAEWVKYEDFCRACPANGAADSNSGAAGGDWTTGIKYHWFPYRNAPT